MARNCRVVPVYPVLEELKGEGEEKMVYTGPSAHMTSNHGWIKHFLIDCCFGEKPSDQKCFDGVYPRDILKSIKEIPRMIIVNTDPSTKTGKQWILLYLTQRQRAEIFDSLGNDVTSYHSSTKNSSRDILLIMCKHFVTEFNPKGQHSEDIIVCIMLILDVRGCLQKRLYILCLPPMDKKMYFHTI